MPTKPKLIQLKQVYDLFAPFWEDWITYKYCGLTDKDIYLINTQVKNNFKFEIESGLMFYNRDEAIKKVTEKLIQSYTDYQDWAITKFQFAVIKCFKGDSVIEWHNKDINRLPLQPELKLILQQFGFRTLNELFNTYSDKHFRDKVLFGYILKFQTKLNQFNTIIREPA